MIVFLALIENEDRRAVMAEIFDAYYPQMKTAAMSILRHPEDAEDAAMNAMLYICLHIELFEEHQTEQIRRLILICARSAAINMYRKNRLRNRTFILSKDDLSLLDLLPDDAPLPPEVAVSKENRAMLRRAIGQLEEMYRVPIMLHYLYNMRNIDIAELLHMDASKINSRIFRARDMLRKSLQEMGYEI